MAKVQFDLDGQRFFETGCSECVLYVKKNDGTYDKGVAWNGLSKVSHSPEGGEETAIYADNIKYLSLRSVENVKGTIECYMTPDAFYPCMGFASASAAIEGVRLAQQVRATFAFCYKSIKGNDANPEKGYIIHVYYGCTVNPSSKDATTVNESPEAATMSFEFSTTPVKVDNFKPLAYLEIDSEKLKSQTGGADKLTAIEEALYGKDPTTVGGNDGSDPTLLDPNAIIAILNAQ